MSENSKSSFVSRLDNLWWKHKWLIISITLIAALLIFSVVSSFRKEKEDVLFLYVGPTTLSISVKDLLQENIGHLIPDVNEDGEGILAVQSLAATSRYELYEVSSDGSETEYSKILLKDKNTDNIEAFNTLITVGDAVIYLLPEYYYDLARAKNLIAPLDTVVEPENMPKTVNDEYSVYLKDLSIRRIPGFDNMPEDTLLCVRRFPDASANELLYGRSEEEYDANIQLFNELLAYKK